MDWTEMNGFSFHLKKNKIQIESLILLFLPEK